MEIKSQMIEFPCSNPKGKTKGYLAQPKDGGDRPGVLVIQEIWGLNENIKDIAGRLAREGYVALAVDLYDGVQLTKLEDGRKIREQISEDAMLRDLDAAYAYLRGMKSIKKIGCVGYCMGGGLSLQLAIRNPDLSAAVIFYGRNPSPIDLVAKIKCPVLGLYAGEDRGITEADVNLLRDAMKKHGKSIDVSIYPGAPHGFFNDTRESYRAEAAKDAWERVLAFYKKNLS